MITFHFEGLLIGIFTFIIIGVFHPLVIKGEYYFGLKCRYWFALAGLFFLIFAILVDNIIISSLLGVIAFSCFWSVKEVNEQVKRVQKGWFPANQKRINKEKEHNNKKNENLL